MKNEWEKLHLRLTTISCLLEDAYDMAPEEIHELYMARALIDLVKQRVQFQIEERMGGESAGLRNRRAQLLDPFVLVQDIESRGLALGVFAQNLEGILLVGLARTQLIQGMAELASQLGVVRG